MNPEERERLLERTRNKANDHIGRAGSALFHYFGDGNTDEEAVASLKSIISDGSRVILNDLEAIEAILADESLDAFIYDLVVYDVGRTLPEYDVAHARAWVRQKATLIRSVYEEEAQARGGVRNWGSLGGKEYRY